MLRLLLLSVCCAAMAFASRPAQAQSDGLITVKVDELHLGRSWDFDGGLGRFGPASGRFQLSSAPPDLKTCLLDFESGEISGCDGLPKVRRYDCLDAFECDASDLKLPAGDFALMVFDIDLAPPHDLAGIVFVAEGRLDPRRPKFESYRKQATRAALRLMGVTRSDSRAARAVRSARYRSVPRSKLSDGVDAGSVFVRLETFK